MVLGLDSDTSKISFLCYACLFALYLLSFGSMLIHTGKIIEANTMQGTAYVKQMAQDWDR